MVALPLDNFPTEEDVFEIEDRKVVIVKFFDSMDGYYVVQRTNTISNSADCGARHSSIVTERRVHAQRNKLRGAPRRARNTVMMHELARRFKARVAARPA
jgi:hypothetical protein